MAALRERLRFSAEGFGLILTQPFGALRRRINAWIMARTQRLPGPVAISRRRVYILPTRYGYAFAFMLLAMLLGAMNYSNSMAFALTFLLSGLGLIGMHHTHGNLVNLRVLGMRAPPVFTGETAQFEIEFENPSRRARWNIAAGWAEREPSGSIDVPTQERAHLTLPLPASRRGWLPAPRFSVSTEFPLGLFHAWTWVELDCACLVYPRPAAGGIEPQGASRTAGTRTGLQAGNDEFAGLRGYQRGDSASRIHWKSLPRLSTPQVKHFADSIDPELWLDWDALPPGLDIEQRLSLLTHWVIAADRAGRRYGLRLPDGLREPAHGEVHRLECLRMLALFGPMEKR
jgi:uncharacterized protein (DUF58 family)